VVWYYKLRVLRLLGLRWFLAGWADFYNYDAVPSELFAEALFVAEVAADDLEIAVGRVHGDS